MTVQENKAIRIFRTEINELISFPLDVLGLELSIVRPILQCENTRALLVFLRYFYFASSCVNSITETRVLYPLFILYLRYGNYNI